MLLFVSRRVRAASKGRDDERARYEIAVNCSEKPRQVWTRFAVPPIGQGYVQRFDRVSVISRLAFPGKFLANFPLATRQRYDRSTTVRVIGGGRIVECDATELSRGPSNGRGGKASRKFL